jgi:predicted O-methyltransferase YrrM
MDENEAYMEIGTYTGYTLCAAGYQNTRVCVGIDDLSMADFVKSEYLNAKQEEVRNTIHANMSRMMNKRIFFIESDFRKVDKVHFDPPTLKIGVAYLDGYHDYAQTKQAIEWTIPQLSDEAIIIMDDVHLPGVYGAIMETVLQPRFYLLFLAMHSPEDWALDEYISTGLAVIQYKRNP